MPRSPTPHHHLLATTFELLQPANSCVWFTQTGLSTLSRQEYSQHRASTTGTSAAYLQRHGRTSRSDTAYRRRNRRRCWCRCCTSLHDIHHAPGRVLHQPEPVKPVETSVERGERKQVTLTKYFNNIKPGRNVVVGYPFVRAGSCRGLVFHALARNKIRGLAKDNQKKKKRNRRAKHRTRQRPAASNQETCSHREPQNCLPAELQDNEK